MTAFSVGFAGSRGLPSVPAAGGLVARVVASVLPRTVFVGCSVGADAAVLSARLALPFSPSTSGPSLRVFSVFGPDGAGSWAGSAVPVVLSAASLALSPGHGCFAPVSVSWFAGGQPALPLRRRLAFRTRRLVLSLPASGSALVAFFGPGRSRGTAFACRLAVERGFPVFAFPVGRASLPPLGPGSWLPAGGSGVWSRSLRWVPA